MLADVQMTPGPPLAVAEKPYFILEFAVLDLVQQDLGQVGDIGLDVQIETEFVAAIQEIQIEGAVTAAAVAQPGPELMALQEAVADLDGAAGILQKELGMGRMDLGALHLGFDGHLFQMGKIGDRAAEIVAGPLGFASQDHVADRLRHMVVTPELQDFFPDCRQVQVLTLQIDQPDLPGRRKGGIGGSRG